VSGELLARATSAHFPALSSSTLSLGSVRATGGRYVARPVSPWGGGCWAGPLPLRRSSRESARFGSGSVGQFTTVVARPGTALRVKVLAESPTLVCARESLGAAQTAPRFYFCFRRAVDRNQRALGAFWKQLAAHRPPLVPVLGRLPRAQSRMAAPLSFRIQPWFPGTTSPQFVEIS
jgi:hypothetical protein